MIKLLEQNFSIASRFKRSNDPLFPRLALQKKSTDNIIVIVVTLERHH